VLFDIEEYNAPLFEYRSRRDAKTKSWEVYARQARLRGHEVMEAFQQGWPDVTIFLTFGYSLPWSNSKETNTSLLIVLSICRSQARKRYTWPLIVSVAT